MHKKGEIAGKVLKELTHPRATRNQKGAQAMENRKKQVVVKKKCKFKH